MTLCALEKLDIGWKDLVAEICRKLETMPVAAQEEMLFSVRVMVANLENTFNMLVVMRVFIYMIVPGPSFSWFFVLKISKLLGFTSLVSFQ